MENKTYLTIAIFILAVCTFGSRILPFAVFGRAQDHPAVQFVSIRLPLMIMPILVFYCMKDLQTSKEYISAVFALLVVAVLQWRFSRALVSIFTGTTIYILLLQIF